MSGQNSGPSWSQDRCRPAGQSAGLWVPRAGVCLLLGEAGPEAEAGLLRTGAGPLMGGDGSWDLWLQGPGGPG